MTDIREIEQAVRAYIIDAFLGGQDAAGFADDDDLLTVLDSLQLLRMVVALESLYSIRVEDGDLSADNLGSVRRVAAFVAGKVGQSVDGFRTVSPNDAGSKTVPATPAAAHVPDGRARE